MKQERRGQEILSSAMNLIDDDLIEETEELRGRTSEKKKRSILFFAGSMTEHRKRWLKGACAAACILLLAVGSMACIRYERSKLPLSDASQNVVVRYTSKPIDIGVACYVDIPGENQVFKRLRGDRSLNVVRGTVEKIDNIEINFRGAKTHEAIARIRVEEVYQGTLKEGSLISARIDAPVDTGDVRCQVRQGTEGIFMPSSYEDGDIWEENGGRLALKDIAEYGIGEFSTFLENREGLFFDRDVYRGIAEAEHLDQVEGYVKERLK